MSVASIFGQERNISGTIKDKQGIPLLGANIKIKGTDIGTSANFDGKFELTLSKESGILVVSYLGCISKEVSFTTVTKEIEVVLENSSENLGEVELFASRVIDRKTPVASSIITKEDIEINLGNQEFVEVFKSTPGVYATKDSGGFGDGEILVRGFQSANVAVLINGIPINDFRDGRVFWSNWGGIGNVTSSTQIQRGLGASKVAAPSIGGTMNIITETSNKEKGGQLLYGLGNDGYTKYGIKLSTGILKNDWSATVYVDRTYGDGYVDGTPFDAVTYFGSITKKINDQHKLVFTGTGAPQRHGGRFSRAPIQTYRTNQRGIRLNQDWGIRNGKVFSLSENFFHKPFVSLNHYWKINDYNKLATSAYYSSGEGGITFNSTATNFSNDESANRDNYRLGELGPIDIDAIVRANQENEESKIFLQTSTNKHVWYGGISTLNSSLADGLNLSSGIDIRYGEREGGRRVEDLLGGQFITIRESDSNVNNPTTIAKQGDRIGFYNSSIVRSLGAFTQLEYDYENITLFAAGNFANSSYKRVDTFSIKNGDENQKTDWVDFFTFGAKGGGNYRLDKQNNIFFNGGYFQRAPFFNAVWPSNNNAETNENAENEKIFSLELGYGLRLKNLRLNLNVYRTEWLDRSETRRSNVVNQAGEREFNNITGINALHQGIEMDFEYRPLKSLTLTGMLSVGDWTWQDDVNVTRLDINQKVIENSDFLVAGLPVGRSAQTTSAFGIDYEITPHTTLYADYNLYYRYFSDFNPNDNSRVVNVLEADPEKVEEAIAIARRNPYELPSYGLFDLAIKHKFEIAKLNASIIARMNNVFNTQYITRADDGDNPDEASRPGTAAGAQVFFGTGRTFTVSTSINF